MRLKEKKKELLELKKRITELKEIITEMEIKTEKEINQVSEEELYTEEPKQEKSEPIILREIDQKKIVKNKILEIIRNENKTSGEIKKEIVDKKKLCSKASYYRYLQELKKTNVIETIKINQEEFYYTK